jgi:hypothetical protein
MATKAYNTTFKFCISIVRERYYAGRLKEKDYIILSVYMIKLYMNLGTGNPPIDPLPV